MGSTVASATVHLRIFSLSGRMGRLRIWGRITDKNLYHCVFERIASDAWFADTPPGYILTTTGFHWESVSIITWFFRYCRTSSTEDSVAIQVIIFFRCSLKFALNNSHISGCVRPFHRSLSCWVAEEIEKNNAQKIIIVCSLFRSSSSHVEAWFFQVFFVNQSHCSILNRASFVFIRSESCNTAFTE